MFITLGFVIFLVVGIAIIIGTGIIAEEMDKACANPDTSAIAEAFNELYGTADDIYCITGSTGCLCYVSDPTRVATGYVAVNTSSTVTKVQECTDHLESAYASYGISFDDIGEIVKYLDYFGEIEKEYTCSGICTQLPKYYFSDINIGIPSKICFDSIKDGLILGDVKNYGIGYTVTGSVLFIIWFIQYGLCCRKKVNARNGETKNF
eukprot:CAMPEP_0205804404 /NCGR_PEP_ID=MMETSP0205-20121125/7319_1 /ASSEMBLY_ACC=CAM_ASM_000278 /TAXON_ID=36767 /ORGANISM="Euplotes focardii, Strain TN1" /LENGTH=206 /DNA_ID=CAMNT_0053073971 /DNA_START=289 /DNA_END=909 /DNA_ORIENTATION=+